MSLLRSRTVSMPMAQPEGGRYKPVDPDRKGNFHWSEVDAESIFQTVAAVTALGDSIMFGKTQKGSCGFIMVVSGGMADKFYPASYTEAQDALQSIFSVAHASEPT